MGSISLDSVSKVYPGGVKAVDSVDLGIEDGEFIVLVGPSGCGKSTLLRMVAGLEEITEGRMYIDGRDVTEVRPRDRDIAMVFQDYALYPQMTVQENVGFGLKLRHVRKPERLARVREVGRTLGLDGLLERKPAFLSGGQRQRVAMGRAIAREPVAFLMDEPLSNLDAKLRVSMRAELARLHDRLGVTTIYVTHDQVEAMTLGRRVAVLRDGLLQQFDTPQNLFHNPINLFVATFIGSPSMNLVEATVADGRISFADVSLPLPPGSPVGRETTECVVGLRPTDIRHTEDAPAGQPRIRVRPDVVEQLGGVTNVLFPLDAPRVTLDDSGTLFRGGEDDETTLLADDQRSRFCASVDGRRRVEVGGEVELAIDPRHLHYFDKSTGETIAGT